MTVGYVAPLPGTMSEAELHFLRSRLLGGKLKKARGGRLSSGRPPGWSMTPKGGSTSTRWAGRAGDPAGLRPVRAVGLGLSVVQHFADHHLRCPTRLWGGSRDGELTWGTLSHNRALAILHNPGYAGPTSTAAPGPAA